VAENQSGAAYHGNFKPQRRTTKVDFFRRWFPLREVSAVDHYPHTLSLPGENKAWNTGGQIVTIHGANEIEVVVSHDNLTSSGLIPDVDKWSGELWVFGGEPAARSFSGNDERRWSQVGCATFAQATGKTWAERFDIAGYLYAMFRISLFEGSGALHLLLRAT